MSTSRFAAAWLAVVLSVPTLDACTIFVLMNDDRVLFCNNEDWSNPRTRIWFRPAGKDHYGCAYLGFDNGWGQGGLNAKGLAYDWVSGFEEQWEPGPELKVPRGNPAERMLESCATVEEAIAFFGEYFEPSFSYGKILVADATGSSAIIGAKKGRLGVQRLRQSRGFGYGAQQLEALLTETSGPTVAEGIRILRACRQSGKFATKYANLFDLVSGDIWLLPHPGLDRRVRLSLADELEKGAHHYDLASIEEQVTQAPLPLLNSMRRFVFDEFQPVPDPDQDLAQQLRALMQDAVSGKMEARDYAPELWQELVGKQSSIRSDLERVGKVRCVTQVERVNEEGRRGGRWVVEFDRAKVLLHVMYDEQGQVTVLNTEANEQAIDPAPRR